MSFEVQTGNMIYYGMSANRDILLNLCLSENVFTRPSLNMYMFRYGILVPVMCYQYLSFPFMYLVPGTRYLVAPCAHTFILSIGTSTSYQYLVGVPGTMHEVAIARLGRIQSNDSTESAPIS